MDRSDRDRVVLTELGSKTRSNERLRTTIPPGCGLILCKVSIPERAARTGELMSLNELAVQRLVTRTTPTPTIGQSHMNIRGTILTVLHEHCPVVVAIAIVVYLI